MIVIELVGSPGAGKSTVIKALVAAGHGRIMREQIRGIHAVPLVVRNAVAAAVPFLLQYRRMQSRRWNRLSLMIRIQTLHDLLERRATHSQIILLDQGPVYMLAILQRALNGPGGQSDSPKFKAFWKDTIQRWSDRLDYVVELEADDTVLHQRIIERGVPHPVKESTGEQLSRFFERSRSSRASILSAMSQLKGAPEVVRLRTDVLTIDDTVDQILSVPRIRTSTKVT